MLVQEIMDAKAAGQEITEILVSCPYCHQSMMVEATEDIKNNGDKCRMLAEEICICKDARRSVERRNQAERLNISINNIVGNNSSAPYEDELIQAIKELAVLVYRKRIDSATIKASKLDKVEIKRDSDGNLFLRREIKQKEAEKV